MNQVFVNLVLLSFTDMISIYLIFAQCCVHLFCVNIFSSSLGCILLKIEQFLYLLTLKMYKNTDKYVKIFLIIPVSILTFNYLMSYISDYFKNSTHLYISKWVTNRSTFKILKHL